LSQEFKQFLGLLEARKFAFWLQIAKEESSRSRVQTTAGTFLPQKKHVNIFVLRVIVMVVNFPCSFKFNISWLSLHAINKPAFIALPMFWYLILTEIAFFHNHSTHESPYSI